MTVWLEKHGYQFEDDHMFAAWMGFRRLGHAIQFFSNPSDIQYQKNDIVVGSVHAVHFILNKLHIQIPQLYIPEHLEKYTGRTITKSTVGEVLKRTMDGESLFIKPIHLKEFPAQVTVPGSELLMTYPDQNFTDLTECWTSTVVPFVAEYRIFMLGQTPIGCHYYRGDFKQSLNWNIITMALKELGSSPAGWCLDWGIDQDGRTLLIEANDGYALGHYGLDCVDYATLLQKRWEELTHKGNVV